MPTLVDPAELVGIAEAAALAGIKHSTMRVMRTRGQLPAPIAMLACGPIWTRSQIEEWAAENAVREGVYLTFDIKP